MQSTIYYPSFAPPDSLWLKFALLYFEKVRPIVPLGIDYPIDENYRRILDYTDLITPVTPSYFHGVEATDAAISYMDKFFKNPYDNSEYFGAVNATRAWNNPENWTFEIFGQKFADRWKSYCLDRYIGKETDNGIILAEIPAFIFMSFLAGTISRTENASIITDNKKFDNFTSYQINTEFGASAIQKRNTFAKGIVELKVPMTLNNISIGKIIEFRNKNRQFINGFNNSLDNIENRIGLGLNERDFIKSYDEMSKGYGKVLLEQSSSLVSLSLTIYAAVNGEFSTASNHLEEILQSVGIITSGTFAMKSILKKDDNAYCKKYLTNLSNLK